MESTDIQSALTGQPDEQIIERILTGEARLYELIVRRYNARLYRVGMSLLNDPTDVEDVMQMAYIKAYEHLQAFERRALFSTWLSRIFINESLLFLKQKKRRAMMQTEGSDMNRAIAGQVTRLPEHAVLNHELKKVLEYALAQLPEKYRLVFVMREVEGMSVSETMAALELTESNVKVRLSRARSMLRETLGSYYRNDVVYQFHLSRCDRMVQHVLQTLKILD